MASGISVLGVWYLFYGVGLAEFPPFDLADYLIQIAPGSLATWAIETFGHWAQRSLMVSGILALLIITTGAAIVFRGRATAASGMIAGLLIAVLA
ncbi:MAG: hypothetical protein ACOC9Y_05655, partial [Chloroflexota bacterium]